MQGSMTTSCITDSHIIVQYPYMVVDLATHWWLVGLAGTVTCICCDKLHVKSTLTFCYRRRGVKLIHVNYLRFALVPEGSVDKC